MRKDLELQRTDTIRVKVMCILEHNGRLLVSRGEDSQKKEVFYRLLGGTLNARETSQLGIRREIQEELGSDLEQLESVDVIENLFTYEGVPCHEIIFLFRAQLKRRELYERTSIHVQEEGYAFDTHWINVADVLSGAVILYPTAQYSTLLSQGPLPRTNP